jgi:hypothetical protein
MKILTLIFALSIYLCNAQGPIASYPLDNQQAIDYANGLNGVLMGGAFACDDRYGNKCAAIYFNGVDAYIEVPHSTVFNSISNAYSISFWFKIDVGESNYLTAVCKGASPAETYLNPHFRLQYFQFNSNSTVSINSDFTEYDVDYLSHIMPNGNWNFYTVTYDGSSVKSYLNNVKISDIAYNGILLTNYDPLYIARDIPGSDEFFKGALDDIKIYDRAITEAEITNLFIEKNNQHLLPDFELCTPDNLIVCTDGSSCSTQVVYPDPKLVINCKVKVELKQVSGLNSGSQFQMGEHIVSYRAISETGYNKTISFKIIVKDNKPPIILSSRDTTVMIAYNQDSISVNYLLPVFNDKCSKVTLKLTSGKKPGKYFRAGINKITYEAVDIAGNKSTTTITITVNKKPAPNAVKPKPAIAIKVAQRKKYSDTLLINDKGKCGALFKVKYSDTNDFISNATAGSFYSVGRFPIIIKNKASDFKDTFNLVVLDKEPPIIKCSKDTIIYINDNLNFVEFEAKLPSSEDNCGVDTIYEINNIEGNYKFPIGITALEYKAIDIAGNSIACKRNIEVVKVDKPLAKMSALGSFTFLPDTLKFNTKFITIRIYDNKQEDNDTVSIYFNGNEIIKRQEIRNKSNGTIVRAIQLSYNGNNELTFKAWNLGGIPPNTLKIEFFEGDITQMPDALKKQKPLFVKIISSTPEQGSGLFLHVK